MRGLLILLLGTSVHLASTGAGAQPVEVRRTPAAPLEDPRMSWRMGSLACLGGGVAALAFGVLAFGKGVDYEQQITDAEKDAAGVVTGLTQREALRLQDAAVDSKGLGAVGFVVGGLLVTTGVVLFLFEPPPALMTPTAPEPEVRPFSLVPTIGPDGAGLSALATF